LNQGRSQGQFREGSVSSSKKKKNGRNSGRILRTQKTVPSAEELREERGDKR